MNHPDPLLLTPGPLTTAPATKQAMLHDWGSRDHRFIGMTADIHSRLLALADATATHSAILLQGSGTFAIEATLATLVPRSGRLLILVNGAYGRRMAQICEYLGRDYVCLETPENVPNDVAALAALLEEDKAISHVAAVHCETTSGILNPIADIATIVQQAKRSLIVDAMSSFGALPLSLQTLPIDALVASSNKCLEGVPGIGFALIRNSVLHKCEGNAHSLSLDLFAQYNGFKKNGQWRFTPPTHVVAALQQALQAHAGEDGVAGRCRRYMENCQLLIDGMVKLGFTPLLPAHLQAPIIVTFHMPTDPHFDFERFYACLSERQFVIYPGKLTVADSFRIGCIGQVFAADIMAFLQAVAEVLADLGIDLLVSDSRARA